MPLAVAAVLAGCGGSSAEPTLPPGKAPTATTVILDQRPTGTATFAADQPVVTGEQDPLTAAIVAIESSEYALVLSSDSALDLLVPNSAFPAGVTADNITARPIDDRTAGITLDSDRDVDIYELGPDGAEFSSPVLMRTKRFADPIAPLPVVFLFSGDEVTPLDSSYEYDPESRILEVSTLVPHFSSLMIDYGSKSPGSAPEDFGGAFILEMTNLGDQEVNVPFAMEAKVKTNRNAEWWSWTFVSPFDGRRLRGQNEVESWALRGEWAAEGNISPRKVPNAPPETLVDGSAFTSRQEHSCFAVGDGSIQYRAVVEFVFNSKYTNLDTGEVSSQSKPITSRAVLSTKTVPFRCLSRAPTATPRPTATTSAALGNQPPEVSLISAVGYPPTTVYTVSVNDPEGAEVKVSWTGPNCAEWGPKESKISGRGEAVMTWTHPSPPCEHPSPDHSDAVITVAVDDGSWIVECDFIGAATGKGDECTVRRQ